MSTTITKEIEIELEYDEIQAAVGELDTYEKSRLIQDCELEEDIKSEISDDLPNFIEENCSDISKNEAVNIIQSVLANSNAPTSDIFNSIFLDLDEDVLSELNVNVAESEKPETDVQKEFLKIVTKIIGEAEIERIVLKHRENQELLQNLLKVVRG